MPTKSRIPLPLREDQHIKPYLSKSKISRNLSRISKERPPRRNDRPIPPIGRKAGRISRDATGY